MNPYKILDVDEQATEAEIKKRYRKLARETHPDLNPGDEVAETRFKEISVAYDILSDPEKRAAFDQFGEISLEAGFDADRARAERTSFEDRFGSANGDHLHGQYNFADLDDLLHGFGRSQGAGGRRRAHFAQRGPDIESVIELDLPDAVRGGEHKMTVERVRADGSRFADSITVRVPPGITSGGRLKIPGKGGEGIGGGSAGDLWLRTKVRPHPTFRMVGRNLEFDLPLTVSEAILGARIEVPTLDEPVTLTIPPGTNSHSRLRLRGKGVPASGSKPAGDLRAIVKIVVPTELDDSQREFLEAIEQPCPREGFPK